MKLLMFIAAAVAVALVVRIALHPVIRLGVVQRRNRFQIVDFLALMVFVQLGVALVVTTRLPVGLAIPLVTAFVLVWTFGSLTAMQMDLQHGWKRFAFQTVQMPALVVLLGFTATCTVLWIGATFDGWVLSYSWWTLTVAYLATVPATLLLRRFTAWLVSDIPDARSRQRDPITGS